jgi:hypothetical protein
MTFSDIPATDGRRIMLTSGRTEYPGMPFNRYMNLPSVMTLKTIAGVPKLHTNPVAEVSLLRTSTMTWGSQTLNTGVNLMSGLSGEGVEFEIVFKPQSRSLVTFKLDKYWVVYNAGQNKIGAGEDGGNGQHRSLTPVNGQVHIRAFYDRGSWELYANGGEFYMPIPITPKAGNFPLSLTTANASIEIISMSLHHLGSANGRIGNFPEEVTNEESNFYSFYPNPVSAGYFMIDRNAFEEKELTIMLFDTAGKEVFKKMLPDGENRVDLSGDLPNGIYHVAIKGNKTIRNGRLLISK